MEILTRMLSLKSYSAEDMLLVTQSDDNGGFDDIFNAVHSFNTFPLST